MSDKPVKITLDIIDAFFKTYKGDDLEMPFYYNEATAFANPKRTIETHLAVLKANRGKPRFLPYYERLLFIYNHFNKN